MASSEELRAVQAHDCSQHPEVQMSTRNVKMVFSRNGLRYLGYAFTCALMQAELVVLIAPYAPCHALAQHVTRPIPGIFVRYKERVRLS